MNWREPRRWRDLVLGAGLLFGVAACTWQGIKPDDATARHLYISGKAGHVSDEQIAKIAAPYLNVSFFDVDIASLQSDLERQPWLRDVSVSRHWPDGVVVQITERKPIALWGDEGVLDANGEVFVPDADARPQGLVQLNGPATAGLKVYDEYQQLSKMLAGHGVALAALTLDKRGSWDARLDNGLQLRLGRDSLAARMQRFVDYALRDNGKARAAVAQAGYVDLRYSDGFAVGGKRATDDTANQEKGDEQAA